MNFFNLKPDAFGLDISDLSLKIVKLKKKARAFDLASFGETIIEPGIIESGEVKDQKALISAIKKSLTQVKGEKIRTMQVIASLPEEKAFLQVIQMPKLKRDEIKKAVMFEAENHIPLGIKDVYLDCQIIKPLHNHHDHLDVLISALPKTTVDPYVFCLKQAGLIPRVLEIEAQAISRAVVEQGIAARPVLLLDLGACKTRFIIFSGRCLRFTTSIPFSGQDKEPALRPLAEQVKKYIDYYQTHRNHEHLPPNGAEISNVLLCGGRANIKGITGFLSEQLNLAVKLANPWVNILSKPANQTSAMSSSESLRFTTALGLAMRASAS